MVDYVIIPKIVEKSRTDEFVGKEYVFRFTCGACGSMCVQIFPADRNGHAPPPYDIPRTLKCKTNNCPGTMWRT